MKTARIALLGMIAAAAFIALPSSAMAALRINQSNTTATNTTPTLLINTNSGLTVTCQNSTIIDLIAPDGRSTVNLGNAAFTNCTAGILGGVTVTQTAAWTDQISLLLDTSTPPRITGITNTFTLPAAGGVRLVTATGCTIVLNGTQSSGSSGALITPATPPALATVNSLDVPGLTGNGANLIVVSATPASACLGVIAAGNTTRFSGNYRLSPAVTGTLV